MTGRMPDCTLASTACQEQDFCLSWAMIPNLWVLGFLVLYLLSSHFFFALFSLPPLELSFSNRDLIISFSCLALLKHLLASLSACRARAQVQAWHRRPGTRWPQLRFNVTSSQSLLVPDSQVPPRGFLNPFRPLCLCVCCSSSPECPSPLY